MLGDIFFGWEGANPPPPPSAPAGQPPRKKSYTRPGRPAGPRKILPEGFFVPSREKNILTLPWLPLSRLAGRGPNHAKAQIPNELRKSKNLKNPSAASCEK